MNLSPSGSKAFLTSSAYLQDISSKERDQKFFFLFGPPSMANMIEELVTLEPVLFQRGDISWGEFEDGFPNLLISHVEKIHGRDVVFLADFLNLRELFTQISVIYALPRYLVRSLTIMLPYFPTGTMERVDSEGQIATAFTLARILTALPLTVRGPAKLVIYDIHALQERFYFGDNIIPVLSSAVPIFLEFLKKNHSNEKIAVAFPDEGAQKRFGRDFPDHIPQIICSKVRDGNKRVVKVKEGNPEGYHVFIIDDLVKTGGTLIECKNVLLSSKAKEVSAFVTHAVFPQDSWKRFTHPTTPPAPGTPAPFKHFYTTDSCPIVAKVLKSVGAPFKILPLAPALAEMILKF